MRRFTTIVLMSLVAALPSLAEEISLKDGTKIVGHMTALTADKIEVETSYGKMQVKRSDVLSINFPENRPAAASTDSSAAKTDARKIDESLNGVLYTNRTAGFTLTLPSDWVINPDLRRSPETLAALSSRDKMRFLMVIQEEYPGTVQSYKDLNLLSAQKNLGSFEEIADSNITIDGKPALLVFYRGTLEKSGNLPVEFLSAFIPSGKTFTKVTAWCVEPLFHDMQPAFEKILNSYHSTGGQTTASSNP